jgi:hypothetical protein
MILLRQMDEDSGQRTEEALTIGNVLRVRDDQAAVAAAALSLVGLVSLLHI